MNKERINLSLFYSDSSSKINISSTVVPKTLAISIASLRDGLYLPFPQEASFQRNCSSGRA